MSNKIKKILKQIEEGKRDNLYDVKISLKDFFSKDSFGVTFLEKVLENDVSIGTLNLGNLNNSIEAAFILGNAHKNYNLLFSLEFEEDTLFTNYDEKRLIDLLLEKNVLNVETLKKIRNHIEIIDLVSNNVYYLLNLNPELIKKLITKKDGMYPIEKYINSSFIDILINQINDFNVLKELCLKYNKYDLLKDANTKILMKKIDSKKTLLEDILSKNIEPSIFKFFPNDIKFINFLRKHNLYNYLKNAKEYVLLRKVKGNKTLLEDIIEHKIEPSISSIFNKETIKILNKLNRLDLINDIDVNFLPSSVYSILGKGDKNKLFIEYLLEKKPKKILSNHIISDDTIIYLFYKYGYFNELAKKISVNKLFKKIDNDLLINIFLKKKLNIKLNISVSSDEIKFLLENKMNDGSTYFDFILENIKTKKIKYNLNNLMVSLTKVEEFINVYFKIIEHDMIEYVDRLNEERLLQEYNGKTLLEHFLNANNDLTINKILTEKIKSKLEIAIILKSYGFQINDIDVPLEKEDYVNEYLNEKEKTFGIGPLVNEGELLLEILKELFENDGKSDMDLINSLILGYRQALFENYDNSIKELKVLIKLKEKNMDKFVYEKIENNAYYSAYLGKVFSNQNIVDTLLHETGHLLHDYLTNESVPKDFFNALEKVRNNPKTLKGVEAFATAYVRIKEKVLEIAENKYASFVKDYYKEEKEKEIKQFLEKKLKENKEKLKKFNISIDKIDVILKDSFTYEEYKKHQKRVFINEYISVILSNEFESLAAIADILDAIYGGELHSGILKNENGEIINKTGGHGIPYYYDYNTSFSEIIANFASIMKSHNSKEALNYLKSLIGEELYNIINDFYQKNIVFASMNEIIIGK